MPASFWAQGATSKVARRAREPPASGGGATAVSLTPAAGKFRLARSLCHVRGRPLRGRFERRSAPCGCWALRASWKTAGTRRPGHDVTSPCSMGEGAGAAATVRVGRRRRPTRSRARREPWGKTMTIRYVPPTTGSHDTSLTLPGLGHSHCCSCVGSVHASKTSRRVKGSRRRTCTVSVTTAPLRHADVSGAV